MWVTFNESRVARWYNSAMTIGPEPKTIRTGATIHSLCVSKGDLAGYKLHARTYGGESDESLCVKRNDTVTTQNFVTLLDNFLNAVFRLWNMLMHNAYKIYSALHKQYTLDRKRLSMKQCVKELTFDLLQRGDSMRERKAEHPGYTVDLSQILGWTAGRKTPE
jgi:hypothetical protein